MTNSSEIVTLFAYFGEVAERSKAADCNSVSYYSRWFESNLSQIIYTRNYIFGNIGNSNEQFLCNKTNLVNTPLANHHVLNFSGAHVSYKSAPKVAQTTVVLNFKRGKFFPLISDSVEKPLVTLSLGIVSSRLNKGASFKKKKSTFLFVASFIRKVLIHSGTRGVGLVIHRTPQYFSEILSTMYTTSVTLYKDPFRNQVTSESLHGKSYKYSIPFILFQKTKSFGYIKAGKKGRLKRKIAKRLVLSNRVTD